MKPEKRPENSGINKEFIPVIFILATPALAFMNGFGVRTASFGFDLYYILPAVFGVIMCFINRIKLTMKYEFALLLVLEIVINIPYMKADNYFNGNYIYLIITYSLIIMFLLMMGLSFAVNNPFYINYYISDKKPYVMIYRLIAAFFLGILAYHVYLFTKILDILKIAF